MIIRNIELNDNSQIKTIIHSVMTEYGADGDGFSIHDSEVENMFKAYTNPNAAYFVIEERDKLLGGAGIGPLADEDNTICELKKMYFLKEIRGKGYGQKLLDKCLSEAIKLNYEKCYIETFSTMSEASKLYLRNGFVRLKNSLGNTGHHGCNIWLIKKLNN